MFSCRQISRDRELFADHLVSDGGVVNVTMVSGGVGVRYCLFRANEAGIIALHKRLFNLLYVELFLSDIFQLRGYCFVPVLCVRVCARARVSE